MATSDIDNVRRYVQEKMQSLPRLEEKLESNSTKILYLIKKLNQLSKVRGVGGSNNTLTQERLMQAAERLRRLGIVIEYSDGRGYMKLKAIDQRGIDTIKRMNTVFPISMIESFLENVTG